MGEPAFPCVPLKAEVPSVPHNERIALEPPGCEVIQEVKS